MILKVTYQIYIVWEQSKQYNMKNTVQQLRGTIHIVSIGVTANHPSIHSLIPNTRAQGHWDEFGLGNGEVVQFSWDDKRAGVFVSAVSVLSCVTFEAVVVISVLLWTGTKHIDL